MLKTSLYSYKPHLQIHLTLVDFYLGQLDYDALDHQVKERREKDQREANELEDYGE